MSDTNAVTSTPTNDAGNANADSQAVNTTASTATAAPAGTTATAPTVPDKYEFAMPDGVELDSAAADEFTAIAKELKLDQTAAQKVADVGAKMAQRQAEAHAKMVETWVEQVKTDTEIGGDKLDANLAVARKAMDAFGSQGLKDLLNTSGLGNHPEVIKAFYKAGKAISEDRFVSGSPKGAETDIAKKLFPTMN
jgi:hypothetical protein